MTHATLEVPDISCGHCKSAIEAAVEPMHGVSTATVEIDRHTVDVDFDADAVELESIITAIEDLGYEVAR